MLEILLALVYIGMFYYRDSFSENLIKNLHYYLNVIISIGLIVVFNPVFEINSVYKISVRPWNQIFNRTFTESIGFSAGITILASVGLKTLLLNLRQHD